MLKHVKHDNTLIISCHYSVCVIYDLSKTDRTANSKLCFLSEEKLHRVIVNLNKTISAAFIMGLARHLEKQNKTAKQQCDVPRNIANFLRHTVYIYI